MIRLPPPIRLEAHPFKEKPIRSQAHLDFVRSKHCLIAGCRVTPVHAHHVRLGSHAGGKIKPGDDKAIGLCLPHHEEAHRGEASFQRKYQIDLQAAALAYSAASPVLRRRRQRERTKGA